MLERLSANAEHAAPRILDGHDALQGAVVVATCNRFEAYLDLERARGRLAGAAVHEAIRAVGAVAGLEADELRATFGFVHGNAVAGHLFSVASGLESVVVGEGEIAGQVRRSLERARAEGTTTPELERLFQRASQTSRARQERDRHRRRGPLARAPRPRPRREPRHRLGRDPRAARRHRPLRRRIARRAARPRRHRRARVLALGPRPRFAASHGIEAVARDDYAAAAASVDVIVTCTTAEHHVVDRALLAVGRERARGIRSAVLAAFAPRCPSRAPVERQLVIDLGLPRNVAPDVVEVPGVELLDLETIQIHAPLEELGATDAARAIVSDDARAFGDARRGARRRARRRGPAQARLRHPRRRDRARPCAWRRRRTHRGGAAPHGRRAAAHADGALARARPGGRAGRLDRRARGDLRRRGPTRPRGAARPSGDGCRRGGAAATAQADAS